MLPAESPQLAFDLFLAFLTALHAMLLARIMAIHARRPARNIITFVRYRHNTAQRSDPFLLINALFTRLPVHSAELQSSRRRQCVGQASFVIRAQTVSTVLCTEWICVVGRHIDKRATENVATSTTTMSMA